MTIIAHPDNLSKTASEERSAKAGAPFGIPENTIPGKGDNPDVCSAEGGGAPSAASNSKLVNTSGNTSATSIPIGILSSPDLESQGDSGQLVETLSDEEGRELQVQNQYGIGIDVHSKFLVASVLVRRDEKIVLFTRQFDTSHAEIKKAKEWATSIVERHSSPKVTVGNGINYCIESTSTFHMPVIHIWEGMPAVVNPMLAKAGRRKSDYAMRFLMREVFSPSIVAEYFSHLPSRIILSSQALS